MSTSKRADGNKLASPRRGSSHSGLISHPQLLTVGDLLSAIEKHRHGEPLAMLRTTAGHFATCTGVPAEGLLIQALIDSERTFERYLRERRFSRNSIRSYRNYTKVLLRNAQALGWIPSRQDIRCEWDRVLAATNKRWTLPLTRFAVANGKTPITFSEADMDNWAREAVIRGCGYSYTISAKAAFRHQVWANKDEPLCPRILAPNPKYAHHGIALADMPKPLREDILDLLKWKQAAYAPGRPKRSRVRPITATHFRKFLEALYGFAVTIAGRDDIVCIDDLVTKQTVDAYLAWALDHQGVRGTSLIPRIGTLNAAAKYFPRFRNNDFRWLAEALNSIPIEPECERLERKARKYAPFNELAGIPLRIREGKTYDRF